MKILKTFEYNFINNIWSLIITLAILTGQLFKFSLKANETTGGVSLLDLVVYIFCLIGFFKIKLSLSKPPKIILSAIFFISVAFLSLALTPLHLKVNEYQVSIYYTLRLSAYIFLAWLIYSNAFNNLKKQITNTLLFSGVGLAILGLSQFIFFPDLLFLSKWGWDPHYFRNISTFLDPNFNGAYLVLTLIILTQSRPKYFYMLFIIVFLALLTTFSRSSYLMFLTAGLSLSFFNKSKDILIKTTVLFFILLVAFQIYVKTISQPRNIDRQQSASLRFNTWQQGLTLFQSFPLLGVGFNSYRFALREYNLGDEEFLVSHGASSNDSSLLFVAATTGIIGLISYLYFLFFVIGESWNNNVILVSATLGLLVHSFFANSLFYPPILLWILLISVNPKK